MLPDRVLAVDLANFINLGLFVATVIAAIIAWQGVKDARDARDEAAEHSAMAAAAAAKSAHAQTRAADALERQAEFAVSQATPIPWIVEQYSRTRWKVRNNSGTAFTKVELASDPDGHVQLLTEIPSRLRAGEAFFFDFGGGMTDPSFVRVTLSWVDETGAGHSDTWTIP